MEFTPLAFDAGVREYESQALSLLDAFRTGDAAALEFFHHHHPRFLNDRIPWLPKDLEDDAIRSAGLCVEDARLALARGYDFKDWDALAAYAGAASSAGSGVYRFEAAVEAVVGGDLEALRVLLRRDPELIRARSARVTHFDPPVHEATLLHYIAANGVEGYRQKTPPNAVEIARELLESGAEVDALAGMYGGRCTTLSMLVSSSPPAEAGLQTALVETLLDYGAAMDGAGEGPWRSPLMTALVFGFGECAELLVRRGAQVDRIEAAAGLGRVEEVRRMLADSDAESRHRALALGAQMGRADVVGALLDAGEDPDRYNPPGSHAHSTPLHQAALGGHEEVVRLLVNRGARLDMKDSIYQSTPLGWAVHGAKERVAEFLRSRGAL